MNIKNVYKKSLSTGSYVKSSILIGMINGMNTALKDQLRMRMWNCFGTWTFNVTTLLKQGDLTLYLLRRRKSVQSLILQYRQMFGVAKRKLETRKISGPEKRNWWDLAVEIYNCGSGCDTCAWLCDKKVRKMVWKVTSWCKYRCSAKILTGTVRIHWKVLEQ